MCLPISSLIACVAASSPPPSPCAVLDSLDYLPEPDIFHDIAGHVPMHTDKRFADTLVRFGEAAHTAARLVQEISDPELQTQRIISITRALARFFWFTIEFGLMRGKNGEVKVYGSGLLDPTEKLRTPYESPEVQRLPHPTGVGD